MLEQLLYISLNGLLHLKLHLLGGGGLLEVFNHKVTGLLSFVTELKKGCFLVGADEGSQEPFLSEGTSTLPLFL